MSRHWMIPVVASMLSIGAICEENTSTMPESPVKAADREGFELGEWQSESFASKATGREVALPGQAGNKMLCVHFQGGDSGKAALKRLTGLSAAAEGKVTFAAYSNEMQPPKVALALCTGEKFTWQESEPQTLKSGWNTLSFDLGGKKWKSEASNWKHEVALADRTDVRAIVVLIYNGPADGVVYLDGLKIDRDDQSSGVEALIKRLGADEFAEREAAEKELSTKNNALESLREMAATSKDPEVLGRVKRIISRLSGTDRQTAQKPANGRRVEVEFPQVEIQVMPRE